MISAKQRFYFGLCSSLLLLGGSIIYLFTRVGEIPIRLGIVVDICAFSAGFVFLLILLREVIKDWQVRISGKRVQGQIIRVESNYWLNLPVIIYYFYKVEKEEYRGSTWTTVHFLDRIPVEGSACWVVYDEKQPQRSVIEDLLKPPL